MTNDDRLNELIQGMRRSIVGLADGIASGLMPNMQAFGRAARRAYRILRRISPTLPRQHGQRCHTNRVGTKWRFDAMVRTSEAIGGRK